MDSTGRPYEYVRYEPMVPAHRSLMSFDPLKADQYDDDCYYAPQNYDHASARR